MHWIIEEASYYPFLKEELEKTGYRYIPVHQHDIDIDSTWDGDDL